MLVGFNVYYSRLYVNISENDYLFNNIPWFPNNIGQQIKEKKREKMPLETEALLHHCQLYDDK